MIHYYDNEKIQNFKYVTDYLCKIDQTTLNQFQGLPRTPRTFFRGQLPAISKTKLGRPRMYDNSSEL